MREQTRKGKPEEIAAKILELEQIHPRPAREIYEPKMDALHKQLEDCLLNYRNANEDRFNLSKALDNHLEVTIDLGAFKPTQDRN